MIFQLTASQGGWRLPCKHSIVPEYFNSQPHKEADGQTLQLKMVGTISTHSLTRRLTGSIVISKRAFKISTHSLTRRLTENISVRAFTDIYFNSQPHKEADIWKASLHYFILISTHSLTRRLTVYGSSGLNPWEFQLTASQGGWPMRFWA